MHKQLIEYICSIFSPHSQKLKCNCSSTTYPTAPRSMDREAKNGINEITLVPRICRELQVASCDYYFEGMILPLTDEESPKKEEDSLLIQRVGSVAGFGARPRVSESFRSQAVKAQSQTAAASIWEICEIEISRERSLYRKSTDNIESRFVS